MRPTLFASILHGWVPLALVTSILAALVYVAAQQNLRSSADDPQIQMAEDAAAALARGRPPGSVAGGDEVDLSQSLAPYLIVYAADGSPLASTARLDGRIPVPPPGVFAFTRSHGEHRLTWQPRPGVRSAICVRWYQGAQSGFVLAGRSLREIEKRERERGLEVFVAWVAALALSLVAIAVSRSLGSRC